MNLCSANEGKPDNVTRRHIPLNITQNGICFISPMKTSDLSYWRNGNAKFSQLFLADLRRRIDHHITAGVVLRESNEVSDAFCSPKERAKPVESKGDAAVRGRTIFKGIHKKT